MYAAWRIHSGDRTALPAQCKYGPDLGVGARRRTANRTSLHIGKCATGRIHSSSTDIGACAGRCTRYRDRNSAGCVDDHGALAAGCCRRLRELVERLAALIRIDAIWLAAEPLDMRAGTDTALARVVKVFGAARPHHAYLFANRRSTRLKVLIYDGFGIWLAARRLNKGCFVWTDGAAPITVALNDEQLRALVTGLPWKTLAHDHMIAVV